jgi:hypothetical protein
MNCALKLIHVTSSSFLRNMRKVNFAKNYRNEIIRHQITSFHLSLIFPKEHIALSFVSSAFDMDGITRRLIVTSLVVAYSPPQIYRVYDARALLPPAAAAVKLVAVTLVTRYVPFRGLHISRL